MLRRSALLLFAVALCISFAVLAGRRLDGAEKGGGGAGVKGLLHNVATAITQPAVALSLVLVLLICVAWSFRRLRLGWLVWRGAGILVPDFQMAGEISGCKPQELSALFRQRLAVLRLDSVSPSPAAATEGAFLDVVSGGGVSSQDVLASLVTLLRAAVPAHAITAHGVLRQHKKGAHRCGVFVQVTQEPSQPSQPIEIWDDSWEQAVQRAADEATAAILPRSRLCRGPWVAWRGSVMPPGLLRAYERASALEEERRFDEALERYWEVLGIDPTNLTARLRLGQLQEKAGLFLDALVTYHRILALARPAAKEPPRGLYRRGARRECERSLSLAKYRAAVLLGDGSIVREWCQTEGGERLDHRAHLRKELAPVLRSLAATNAKRRDPATAAIAEATSVLLAAPPQVHPYSERNANCGGPDGRR